MKPDEVSLRSLTPSLWVAERMLDEGMNVVAFVVLGEVASAVIDTLTRPEDMEGVRGILREHGRPAFVVNTHADWDHTWGNSAFPNSPIIAHRLCRAGMLGAGQRELNRKQATEPGRYDEVTITPPTTTFSEFMEIDLGGVTLSIQHVPGHTADEIVVHLPAEGILIAGDAAEWPIPTVHDGPIGEWAAALRRWAARDDVETVIPSHGPVSDAFLLRDNAEYLEDLLADPDMRWTCPPDAPRFYEEAHAQNAALARRERAKRR